MIKLLKISILCLLAIVAGQAYGKGKQNNSYSSTYIEDRYKEAINNMRNGRTDDVEKLINRKDFNPNFQFDPGTVTLLMAATLGGHVEIVKKLIEKGADVNAYSVGYPTFKLFQKGFDVVVYGERSTPLIKATENGNDEIVGLLLEVGAYVNAESEYGNRAVDLAFSLRKINGKACLYKLINADNFNLDLQNKNGDTLLMLAAENGELKLARKLLEKGADVRLRDNNGETALMKANELYFNEEVILLLIAFGADIRELGEPSEVLTSLILFMFFLQNIVIP